MTLKETGHICSLIMLYADMKKEYDEWPMDNNKKIAMYMAQVYANCILDLKAVLELELEDGDR